ncbi:hypothetical protein PYCC9005_001553 [Savitreella phatthalungensis]
MQNANTNNPAPAAADIHEFACLYSADRHKKRKAWHDGFIRIHTFNERLILYDETRRQIESRFCFKIMPEEGDDLSLDRHLVNVVSKLETTQANLQHVIRTPKAHAISPEPRAAAHGRRLGCTNVLMGKDPNALHHVPAMSKRPAFSSPLKTNPNLPSTPWRPAMSSPLRSKPQPSNKAVDLTSRHSLAQITAASQTPTRQTEATEQVQELAVEARPTLAPLSVAVKPARPPANRLMSLARKPTKHTHDLVDLVTPATADLSEVYEPHLPEVRNLQASMAMATDFPEPVQQLADQPVASHRPELLLLSPPDEIEMQDANPILYQLSPELPLEPSPAAAHRVHEIEDAEQRLSAPLFLPDEDDCDLLVLSPRQPPVATNISLAATENATTMSQAFEEFIAGSAMESADAQAIPKPLLAAKPPADCAIPESVMTEVPSMPVFEPIEADSPEAGYRESDKMHSQPEVCDIELPAEGADNEEAAEHAPPGTAPPPVRRELNYRVDVESDEDGFVSAPKSKQKKTGKRMTGKRKARSLAPIAAAVVQSDKQERLDRILGKHLDALCTPPEPPVLPIDPAECGAGGTEVVTCERSRSPYVQLDEPPARSSVSRLGARRSNATAAVLPPAPSVTGGALAGSASSDVAAPGRRLQLGIATKRARKTLLAQALTPPSAREPPAADSSMSSAEIQAASFPLPLPRPAKMMTSKPERPVSAPSAPSHGTKGTTTTKDSDQSDERYISLTPGREMAPDLHGRAPDFMTAGSFHLGRVLRHDVPLKSVGMTTRQLESFDIGTQASQYD